MTDQPLIPPLRPDVTVGDNPDNPDFPHFLFDEAFNRRIKLDPRSRAVTALLDREQTLEELMARAADAEIEVKAETLGRVVEFLARHSLLEEPLLFMGDEDSFSCVMCGSCCGGHNVGPVEPEIVRKLQPKREELLKLTGSNKRLLFEIPIEGEERSTVATQMNHGHCVFLDTDNLCMLHRHFGPDHKPQVCHIFPFHFVRTPAGVVVSYQMECRSYLPSKRAAKRPLTAQRKQFRKLVRAISGDMPTLSGPIGLDGSVALDFGQYMGLEQKAIALIRAHRNDTRQGIVQVGRLLDAVSKQAGSPGGAETDDDPQQLLKQFKGFRDLLLTDVRQVHDRFVKDREVHAPRLEYFIRSVEALCDDLPRSMKRLDDADVEELWYDAYRHYFHSKDIAFYPDLLFGQALFGMRYVFTQVLAAVRAREVVRAYTDPRDISDALVLVNYIFRNKVIVAVLLDHRETIIELFHRRLPLLFSQHVEMKSISEELEFYLF